VGAGFVGQPTSIRGVVGRIDWGYFRAAAINGYTVTRTGDTWTLRGTVVARDAFNLTRTPLIFVAPTKPFGELRWPIESFAIGDDGVLRARLSPRLE
jgi:hypothetical protein